MWNTPEQLVWIQFTYLQSDGFREEDVCFLSS